MSKCYQIMAIW